MRIMRLLCLTALCTEFETRPLMRRLLYLWFGVQILNKSMAYFFSLFILLYVNMYSKIIFKYAYMYNIVTKNYFAFVVLYCDRHARPFASFVTNLNVCKPGPRS